jgi:hypothetical protein
MNNTEIKNRLEELRIELRDESISYEELSELQSLSAHISPDDVELLEAAGVPEGEAAWVCTDPDMNQWGRKIEERTYEFKQYMGYPDGSKVKEEEIINLNKYTDKQIADHISTFGYTIEGLKKDCPNDGGDWLIAECIFENIAC